MSLNSKSLRGGHVPENLHERGPAPLRYAFRRIQHKPPHHGTVCKEPEAHEAGIGSKKQAHGEANAEPGAEGSTLSTHFCR